MAKKIRIKTTIHRNNAVIVTFIGGKRIIQRVRW